MNGVLVTALVKAFKEPRATLGPIRLGNGEDHGAPNENPLAGVNVPRNTLILLFGASVVGSIASAFIFTVSFNLAIVKSYPDIANAVRRGWELMNRSASILLVHYIHSHVSYCTNEFGTKQQENGNERV
jgi:hypothetical protein